MNTQRKPGDWNCNSCQHLNFSRRDFCQRCRATRSDLQLGDGRCIGGVLTSLDVRPGDWYCNCGYHNFASRSNCLKCGTIVRDFPAGQGGTGAAESGGVRAGWKTGLAVMCTTLQAELSAIIAMHLGKQVFLPL
ncbi:putative RNA-binding protein C17H9.04c-like [Hordeum vulgare]|nr:putative RNA-binding protein C17H9.04c-like [Hordeum vulgare]